MAGAVRSVQVVTRWRGSCKAYYRPIQFKLYMNARCSLRRAPERRSRMDVVIEVAESRGVCSVLQDGARVSGVRPDVAPFGMPHGQCANCAPATSRHGRCLNASALPMRARPDQEFALNEMLPVGNVAVRIHPGKTPVSLFAFAPSPALLLGWKAVLHSLKETGPDWDSRANSESFERCHVCSCSYPGSQAVRVVPPFLGR
jgi:hypothetical protein